MDTYRHIPYGDRLLRVIYGNYVNDPDNIALVNHFLAKKIEF